ncbi:DNA polymerase III gamma and tau subunits [Calothrix sp. NIES-4101]|nr:DNA polymerase III gamma and tau subunits [Calothrix sp. NIES-4101]
MSYEPLHHKYRPKSFAELVGQEAIATTLTNAISTSRIAPAYLFTGPRGTGKTSSARILAKSLNCLNSQQPTATPCGVCDVCQGISKGYSIDVIEIDAASNTGVDNIREIIERAQFAPVQCRYKVYAIDECHMLSTQAFNALLKTLEEPPKHIVFVLATTDPQRVLPTIISRCQRFDFRRIPLESMVKHLTYISIQENIHISEDAITLVAQLSQGGLRDAESLLDQLSLLSGEVTPDKVWDLVGTVSEKDLFALVSAIASDNGEVVIDSIRKILDRGREPLVVLQNLAGFYRDLLIAKTAPNRGDLVACTQETWLSLVQFSQQISINSILAGQQHLRSAEVQLKNTTQPRLWLEVTILGLLPSAQQQQIITTNIPPTNIAPISNQQSVTNNQVATNNQSVTNNQVATNHQPTNNQPVTNNQVLTNHQPTNNQPATNNQVATHQQPTNNQQDLIQVWQQVLSHLEPVSRRELLRQMCHVIELQEKTARLGIKQAWFKRVQTDLPIITAAFKSAFQRDIRIDVEVANSLPPQTASRDKHSLNGSTRHTPQSNFDASSNFPASTNIAAQPTTPPSSEDSPPVNQTSVNPTFPANQQAASNDTANNWNGTNGYGNNGNSNNYVNNANNNGNNKSNTNEINQNGTNNSISNVNNNINHGVENSLTTPPQPQENIQSAIPIAPIINDAIAEKLLHAAERLADFFDGKVIGFSEDDAEIGDLGTSPELMEIGDDD